MYSRLKNKNMSKEKPILEDVETTKKVSPKVKSKAETQKPVQQKPTQKEKKKKVGIKDVINAFFNAYGENGTDTGIRNCPKVISGYLKEKLSSHPVYETYNLLILFDESSLIKGDSDKIYNAVTKFKEEKPILLVLYSIGGSAASAYLIGKLCREYSKDEFHVAVPRSAKSAATMICCAANNIHMGSLSELGPIDPQINELPALGLKNSVEHIAELVKAYPESSSMFADYLNQSMPIIYLGYYERVAESALQYAEKLLLTHKENLSKPAKDIAQELVYKYKDHRFVIDRSEAELIFGKNIIKSNTIEYEFSNLLYNELDLILN